MDVVFAIVFMLVVVTVVGISIASDKCLHLVALVALSMAAVIGGGLLFALGLALAHWMGIY